jgi:predicted RecB family nuclease
MTPSTSNWAKKPKLDYQLVSAYHAYLLAQMQGNWPAASWLALRAGRYYSVDLVQQLPKMAAVVTDCWHSLRSPLPARGLHRPQPLRPVPLV